MVKYDHSQRFLYEGELKPTANGFRWLKENSKFIKGQADQLSEIVFEATGIFWHRKITKYERMPVRQYGSRIDVQCGQNRVH